MIEARATGLPDVLLLETPVYGDGRGSFLECYNERDFGQATGTPVLSAKDARAPRFLDAEPVA